VDQAQDEQSEQAGFIRGSLDVTPTATILRAGTETIG
jgi:hypothetical protein